MPVPDGNGNEPVPEGGGPGGKGNPPAGGVPEGNGADTVPLGALTGAAVAAIANARRGIQARMMLVVVVVV